MSLGKRRPYSRENRAPYPASLLPLPGAVSFTPRQRPGHTGVPFPPLMAGRRRPGGIPPSSWPSAAESSFSCPLGAPPESEKGASHAPAISLAWGFLPHAVNIQGLIGCGCPGRRGGPCVRPAVWHGLSSPAPAGDKPPRYGLVEPHYFFIPHWPGAYRKGAPPPFSGQEDPWPEQRPGIPAERSTT